MDMYETGIFIWGAVTQGAWGTMASMSEAPAGNLGRSDPRS